MKRGNNRRLYSFMAENQFMQYQRELNSLEIIQPASKHAPLHFMSKDLPQVFWVVVMVVLMVLVEINYSVCIKHQAKRHVVGVELTYKGASWKSRHPSPTAECVRDPFLTQRKTGKPQHPCWGSNSDRI